MWCEIHWFPPPPHIQEEKEEEQTEFTVKLMAYTEGSKIKVIKEVKTLTEGMNLVQVNGCFPLNALGVYKGGK